MTMLDISKTKTNHTPIKLTTCPFTLLQLSVFHLQTELNKKSAINLRSTRQKVGYSGLKWRWSIRLTFGTYYCSGLVFSWICHRKISKSTLTKTRTFTQLYWPSTISSHRLVLSNSNSNDFRRARSTEPCSRIHFISIKVTLVSQKITVTWLRI
jgi:hypothetical protein